MRSSSGLPLLPALRLLCQLLRLRTESLKFSGLAKILAGGRPAGGGLDSNHTVTSMVGEYRYHLLKQCIRISWKIF